jgi:ABC-2 type transport system ATP-binding protein
LADRVAIMGAGRIVALDTPAKLNAMVARQAITLTTVEPVDADDLARALGHPVVATGPLAVRVDADPSPELVSEITRLLAARGILIREMRVATSSLEETYLLLTGDGAPPATDVAAPARAISSGVPGGATP